MPGATARQRPITRRRRRVGLAGALAGAAAVTVVMVLLTQSGDEGADRLAAGAVLAPMEVETGVVHVHGLGVDPGDGVLYAATHSGLFRVPGQGKASRVANRAQDTMGFSVVGPGRFIGSGHPDPREDDVRPPLLGLIESDDRGQTWDRISLHGKADFHALQAAHGNVYGYDSTSQTFMVSRNSKDWDRRSTVPLADFAVDPTDPDILLATTAKGVVRSVDGGRGWTPVTGAPTLVVLTWAGPGRLYGVTPDGMVQQSTDGGLSWGRRGSVGGQPEAITADVRGGRETLYIAASDRGILASTDQGRTFTTRYAE